MSDLMAIFFSKLISRVADHDSGRSLQRAEHRKDLGAVVAWKRRDGNPTSVQIQPTHRQADEIGIILKGQNRRFFLHDLQQADSVAGMIVDLDDRAPEHREVG